MMKKIQRFLSDPLSRFRFLSRLGLYNFMSDEKYIKRLYCLVTGNDLDLDNPKTFNEKLQWLKFHDRKTIYTTMVDKYEAKKYVASVIGDEYIIPTLGVYNKFDEINFDKLPNQFVIKCTHDSGGLVIVKDKNEFDKKKTRKKINNRLKRNYYYGGREWPYKNVKPRIIVEKYMEDKGSSAMRDYKFLCFNGKPEMLYISDGSHTEEQKIAFFDKNFKQLRIRRTDYKDYDEIPRRPKNFEKMKKLSAVLSKDITHVRVDWYEIDGKLYFGELTFFTCGGMIPFEEEGWNKKLGRLIDLRQKTNEIKESN